MRVRILETCEVSTDGVRLQEFVEGSIVDLPANLVPGLIAKGRVEFAPKDEPIAKSTRVQTSTGSGGSRGGPKPEPEPVPDITDVRREYTRVVGRRPYNGWDIATLRQKIAEASEQ